MALMNCIIIYKTFEIKRFQQAMTFEITDAFPIVSQSIQMKIEPLNTVLSFEQHQTRDGEEERETSKRQKIKLEQ